MVMEFCFLDGMTEIGKEFDEKAVLCRTLSLVFNEIVVLNNKGFKLFL